MTDEESAEWAKKREYADWLESLEYGDMIALEDVTRPDQHRWSATVQGHSETRIFTRLAHFCRSEGFQMQGPYGRNVRIVMPPPAPTNA